MSPRLFNEVLTNPKSASARVPSRCHIHLIKLHPFLSACGYQLRVFPKVGGHNQRLQFQFGVELEGLGDRDRAGITDLVAVEVNIVQDGVEL